MGAGTSSVSVSRPFQYLNDTWEYDPAANTWSELVPEGDLPPVRFHHAMAYDPDRGEMVVFGGWNSHDSALGDCWAYDPSMNTWSRLQQLAMIRQPVPGTPWCTTPSEAEWSCSEAGACRID
jgi:N-acetylneuraminic acid mutarotase